MDLAGRTDCTLTSDVQTFLRVGIGVVSQTHAALTFKVRPERPQALAGLPVDRLFPRSRTAGSPERHDRLRSPSTSRVQDVRRDAKPAARRCRGDSPGSRCVGA